MNENAFHLSSYSVPEGGSGRNYESVCSLKALFLSLS